MEFIYLIFLMLALGFGFRMWRLTLARGGLFPLSADCSVVMCGAWPGTLVNLTVASSQYDMLLCSETLVSDLRHVTELLVPGFGRPVLLCRGRLPRARGMASIISSTQV